MRSSKSRSRSKSNRRSSSPVGNIINRVFDSSGPEGKVRGTPQQIIEKYQSLARDAQLSNDRVAAENFLQHAEHYTRLLSDATREEQLRREQHEQQQQQHNQNRDQHSQNQNRNNKSERSEGDATEAAPSEERSEAPARRERNFRRPREQHSDQPSHADATVQNQDKPEGRKKPGGLMQDVIDMSDDSTGGLVDTPESAPKAPRKPRAQRKPKSDDTPGDQTTKPAAE